jgi:hypothetical protein
MTLDLLEAALDEGEALRHHSLLRTGGTAGLTDDRLLVLDEERVSAELDAIEEVTVQTLDRFLVVLSVLLVGFGLYSTRMHVLGGVAFALVGLASCYWTYRNRNEVLVRVRGRANPLKLYPVETEPFRAALERALDRRQAKLDAEAESGR